MNTYNFKAKALAFVIGACIYTPVTMFACVDAEAKIAATHIYHNHMPNFWPYYDTSSYASTAVGAPIRYTYDGQAYKLKLSPPANYTYFLANGKPMPHDDYDAYYNHDAKQHAYSSWPATTARSNNSSHPLSQTQVTMSASVINNLQSFAELGILNFRLGWADDWKKTVGSVKTTNGFNALEPIHFTGHHSMGPLVGPDYFLKDLIYQNVTLQQDYFLGSKFKSSKGFFPTELGFSERLIPTLRKLGIEWSVAGNNHFSRALLDYPYLDHPAKDTMVSPPNRADLQNTYEAGEWVSVGMNHEKQNIVNKFPFCAIPHWVQYVDPETGKIDKIAAIPVDQNGSWTEGWEGFADATTEIDRPSYEKDANGRVMYFVIAHDGDNSQGRAGSYDTWMNSGKEYSAQGVVGMGVQEYLKAHPIPEDDIQHIQDGSWVDTRDSSSDPDWYHWHIPMGVWAGQFADFNRALGTNFENLKNHSGTPFGHAVSMEYGYHYLERNFALLQASLNYAKTAEQIWLDTHPNYWSPKTDAEKQVTYEGNQLNPYMMSYPVKGDEANDYKGGANPAELGWYFLIAAIDSGFGYYDENTDDNVKPTLSFNQSLFFTEPYVQKNLMKDKTGPSMWWVQRYPTNPGSANSGKAEGWTTAYADNTFVIYTYAYDVSGIDDVKVYIRPHKAKRMGPTDIAPRVYDPSKFAGQPNVDVDQVGEWKAYPTKMRNLEPDMNGVAWQTYPEALNYEVVPAKKIGNTYYAYISDYRDQLVDYYMEATDKLGNVTRSEIQHTYVGAGRYKNEGGLVVEDVDGDIEGVHMFFSDGSVVLQDQVTVYAEVSDDSVTSQYIEYKDKGTDGWNSETMKKVKNSKYFKTSIKYTRDAGCADVRTHSALSDKYLPSKEGQCLTKGTYTIYEDGSVKNTSPTDIANLITFYFKPSSSLSKVCVHYRPLPGSDDAWTKVPGVEMTKADKGWFKHEADLGTNATGYEFLFNDCGDKWFKSSNGGNFISNSVVDSNVDGNKFNTGIPSDLDVGNKGPVAVISASKTSIKPGETVTLDGSGSSDPDGNITAYKWSTGETSKSISVSPAKTTTYTLTVTDDKGSSASKSITIKVEQGENQGPTAKITASKTTIEAGENVTLSGKDSVDTDGKIVSYKWSTGETNATITVSPKVTTVYTLTVTDDKGAKNEASVTIIVNSDVAEVLIPKFNTNIEGSDAKTINFLNDSTVSGLTDVTYEWDFGDESTSTDMNPTHTYQDNGTYNVVLTVTGKDKNGNKVSQSVTAEVTISVIVEVEAIITTKDNVTTINPGESLTLDASSSKGANLAFLWSTGEDTKTITVSPDATTTYKLTVTDKKTSRKDTAEITVIVEGTTNHAPVASIASNKVNNTITEGDSITLNGSYTDEDGDSASFLWSTGESSASITVSPTTDTVYQLTVTDSNGAQGTASIKVTVKPISEKIAPVAKITPFGQINTYTGTSIVFNGSASYDDDQITQYKWSVNSKTEVTGKRSTFKFTPSKAGTYTITLEVVDNDGLKSTDSAEVIVTKPSPVAPKLTTIFHGEKFVEVNKKATFDPSSSASSAGKITAYKWYVDGDRIKTMTTDAAFNHTFNVAGTHVVTLVVEDESGNTAIYSQEVYVNNKVKKVPTISFDSEDTKHDVTTDESKYVSKPLTMNKAVTVNTNNFKDKVVIRIFKNYFNGARTNAEDVYVTETTSSSQDLCQITTKNEVYCSDEYKPGASDYIEVDSASNAIFKFMEEGKYSINMNGKTVDDDTYSGVVNVSVEANSDPIPDPEPEEPSNGGSGGGSSSPLSVLVLAMLAFLARRKANK
jgi:PKD repeat protein